MKTTKENEETQQTDSEQRMIFHPQSGFRRIYTGSNTELNLIKILQNTLRSTCRKQETCSDVLIQCGFSLPGFWRCFHAEQERTANYKINKPLLLVTKGVPESSRWEGAPLQINVANGAHLFYWFLIWRFIYKIPAFLFFLFSPSWYICHVTSDWWPWLLWTWPV